LSLLLEGGVSGNSLAGQRKWTARRATKPERQSKEEGQCETKSCAKLGGRNPADKKSKPAAGTQWVAAIVRIKALGVDILARANGLWKVVFLTLIGLLLGDGIKRDLTRPSC